MNEVRTVIAGYEVQILGPYDKSDNPYGDGATCHRQEWYVSWVDSSKPLNWWQKEDERFNGLAKIVQYKGQSNRYIIPAALEEKSITIPEASTLEAIIIRAMTENIRYLF